MPPAWSLPTLFDPARAPPPKAARRQRSREWLVGLEVALSTVLLVMAALLGVSFFRVTNVERGYGVDRILTADLALPDSRYPKDEQRALFHQRALEKLETLPGVRVGRADQLTAVESSGVGRCHQQGRRHAPQGRAAAGALPLCERALFRNHGSRAAARPLSHRA